MSEIIFLAIGVLASAPIWLSIGWCFAKDVYQEKLSEPNGPWSSYKSVETRGGNTALFKVNGEGLAQSIPNCWLTDIDPKIINDYVEEFRSFLQFKNKHQGINK